MSKAKLSIFLLIAALLLSAVQPAKAAGEASVSQQASEVFALINNYRSANGLAALQSNAILYQTAQAQSDYQASIGQITHGGPGGNRPIDRAYAAGYGDGQIIFISELITGGTGQDPQEALNWWQNSTEHNFYLLHSDYVDLGIGVASDSSGRFYYTAVMGHIAGGTTYVPASEEEAAAVEAQPLIIPVTRDEPRENGAIVHIVRTGQALWNIAAVYEVDLETIYALNNLNANSFIFPGDEIILKQADPPTPTQPPASPTPEASATTAPTATRSPAATATPESVALSSSEESAPTEAHPEDANASVRLTIFIALGGIVAVIIATFFIRGNNESNAQD